MKLNTNIKLVYQDNQQTKVLKGTLVEEDQHTFTLSMDNGKEVVIGKSALIKATYDDGLYNGEKYGSNP